MIILGRRCFGATDEVPRVFHVETKFFHFQFIPLVPLESYLVLEFRLSTVGPQRRVAVPIPLSEKSIAVAWIRFLSVILMIGALTWVIIATSVPDPLISNCVASLVALAATIALAVYLMFGKWTRMATYERATELCSYLRNRNFKARLQRLVDRHFQQNGEFVTVATVASCLEDDDEQFEDELVGDLSDDNDPTAVSKLPIAEPVDLELAETSTSKKVSSSTTKVMGIPSENVVV